MQRGKRLEIKRVRQASLECLQIMDTHTGESLTILPEMGGALKDLVFLFSGSHQSIMDGYADREEFVSRHTALYKGSKLFPFANRIKDGTYHFEGKSYRLSINEADNRNAIHGLVHDLPFEIKKCIADDRSALIVLKYVHTSSDPLTDAYPFDFALQIEYSWNVASGFTCSSIVQNTGSCSFPFVDGWHPYFQIGSDLEGVQLKFPAKHAFLCDARGIPTTRTTAFNKFAELENIGMHTFDTCFELKPNAGKIPGMAEIFLQNPDAGIAFKIWQDAGAGAYSYLQIYTPTDRKLIAIEPMSAIPDAFNNGIGLAVLHPGQKRRLEWGVQKIEV